MAEEGRPFRAFARETLALALLQHGKMDEARSSLVVLKNSLDTPREISQRADLALASIDSGTAGNLAAIRAAMADAEKEAEAASARAAAAAQAQRGQTAPAAPARP